MRCCCFEEDWSDRDPANSNRPTSNRLGNHIDAWYFGSLGARHQRREKGLLQSQPPGSLAATMQLDDGSVTLKDPVRRRKLKEAGAKWWVLYFYENIELALPEIGVDLRAKLAMHARAQPELSAAVARWDCVIHYRVGDFIRLGCCVHPASIVEVVAREQPRTICLMGGGVQHKCIHHRTRPTTA